jgi:hypothetical protein
VTERGRSARSARQRRNVTILQRDLIDIVEHDVQDVLTDIARLKLRGITFFVQDQSMSSATAGAAEAKATLFTQSSTNSATFTRACDARSSKGGTSIASFRTPLRSSHFG